jgi:hypothetical protein
MACGYCTLKKETEERKKRNKRHGNEEHMVMLLRLFVNGTGIEMYSQM